MRLATLLCASGVVATAAAAAAAIVPRQTNSTCTNPRKRVEWRQLSVADRKNYVDAVNCLTTKPSRIGLSTPLYDDFPYVHNQLNNEIHFVASFLPWHRYFVSVYEQALQDCGYSGVATYWDWTLDVANVSQSAIWDPNTGLGGNGSPNKVEVISSTRIQCVADGPFKDLRVSYYGSDMVDHCLVRSWNNGSSSVGDMLAEFYTPEVVQEIQALGDYDTYRKKLESGPHGAIHSAVGGDMSPATSPNDPLFFLHHTQIDRLWWLWQQQDPDTRNSEYAGIRTQDKFDGTTPPAATVDDIMPMLGLADDLAIKEILTTESSRLCYTY